MVKIHILRFVYIIFYVLYTGYYGSDGYADDGYDNNYRRPYGPPQAIDIPGYNKGHENSLDWGQNGYGHGYQGGSYQVTEPVPLNCQIEKKNILLYSISCQKRLYYRWPALPY